MSFSCGVGTSPPSANFGEVPALNDAIGLPSTVPSSEPPTKPLNTMSCGPTKPFP
jgi:hypothetical protein